MLMRGKSPHTDYSKGEIKLLYVKDYPAEKLSKQHSIFTYEKHASNENKAVNYETQRKITSFNGNNNATKLTNDAKRKSMTVVECNIKVKRTK